MNGNEKVYSKNNLILRVLFKLKWCEIKNTERSPWHVFVLRSIFFFMVWHIRGAHHGSTSNKCLAFNSLHLVNLK